MKKAVVSCGGLIIFKCDVFFVCVSLISVELKLVCVLVCQDIVET